MESEWISIIAAVVTAAGVAASAAHSTHKLLKEGRMPWEEPGAHYKAFEHAGHGPIAEKIDQAAGLPTSRPLDAPDIEWGDAGKELGIRSAGRIASAIPIASAYAPAAETIGASVGNVLGETAGNVAEFAAEIPGHVREGMEFLQTGLDTITEPVREALPNFLTDVSETVVENFGWRGTGQDGGTVAGGQAALDTAGKAPAPSGFLDAAESSLEGASRTGLGRMLPEKYADSITGGLRDALTGGAKRTAATAIFDRDADDKDLAASFLSGAAMSTVNSAVNAITGISADPAITGNVAPRNATPKNVAPPQPVSRPAAGLFGQALMEPGDSYSPSTSRVPRQLLAAMRREIPRVTQPLQREVGAQIEGAVGTSPEERLRRERERIRRVLAPDTRSLSQMMNQRINPYQGSRLGPRYIPRIPSLRGPRRLA